MLKSAEQWLKPEFENHMYGFAIVILTGISGFWLLTVRKSKGKVGNLHRFFKKQLYGDLIYIPSIYPS